MALVEPLTLVMSMPHHRMIRQIERYELKYLLPLTRCAQIKEDLEASMSPDVHGGRAGYPLINLYYDTRGLSFFWAKLDGSGGRRKLRLRAYPSALGAALERVVVEIKEHADRRVLKRRLDLPLASAEQLCAGVLAIEEHDQCDDFDRGVAAEVANLVRRLRLRPSAVTSYHRLAFVDDYDATRVRVTFDCDLQGRLNDLKVDGLAPNHRLIGREWCVMEVKLSGEMPAWLAALLTRHHCHRQQISKYCAAIAQLSGGAVPPWVLAKTSSLAHT